MIQKLKKIKNFIFGNYSTDVAFRYMPLVSLIKRDGFNNKKILEVGSGDTGIAVYLSQDITGLDVYFDENKIKNLEKVKYEGEIFPFEDNFFSLTISVDSLEHVLPAKREKFIQEMIRVSREGIILMVPAGRSSYQHDERLGKYFYQINKKSDKFINEHLRNGLPEDFEIKDYIEKACIALGKKGEVVISEKMLNLKFREMIMYCKISQNIFLSTLYYSFIILLPSWRLLNFGQCYRSLVYFKIKQ